MKILALSIADYSEATDGMPYDVERLFFRFLLKMYSREDGLPDDDADNARLFGYDIRVYKRLKAKLLKWPNAIYIEDGLLKNERVEKDLAGYRSRKRSAATSRQDRADFRETSPELPAKVRQKSYRISYATRCENNDLSSPSPSPTPSPTPSPGLKIASVEQDAARDELAGLNGSAALMLADVIGWTHNGDERHARRWLSSQIAAYGTSVTRDAWAKLKTDIAEGEIIARPLQTWCKIAQRLQERTAAPLAVRPAKKSFLQIIDEWEAARVQ